jgi:hypothetical protein
VKYFATWQPLRSEDAHTALTFGFLRHAPTELALTPWLGLALGRQVTAGPLKPQNFWPMYDSVMVGNQWTEPDVVFEADDGDPLLVIIEVKPGLAMHVFDQVSREIIDVASTETAPRIALVMIGADLGAPPELDAWRNRLERVLADHGLAAVVAELHYSSWASLGRAIARCAELSPEWRRYAEDVIEQLRVQGLLGYDGAPVFEDLENLTVVNAVEAFNRTIRAARQLLLTLHSRPAFHASGYLPFGRTFALQRDGTSSALTQAEDFFTTSVALSVYRKASWPKGAGVYVAVDLASDEEPHLQAGAFFAKVSDELVWSFAYADEKDSVSVRELGRTDKTRLPYVAAGRQTEWVYDTLPWRAGQPDDDIIWALEKLAAGSTAWDDAGPATSDM